jgi:twitching motility protein PilT
MSVTIQELLKSTVDRDASDLHITTYIPPRIRIHGSLVSLDYPPLTPTETKTLIYSLLTDKQKKNFEEKLELDFSFGIQDLGRFRANVFMQKSAVAAAIRRFMPSMWSFEQLGLPQSLAELCYLPRGLVLVTGPTGSGKSTTLACLIDHINKERPVHIVTIEDPIEYFFTPKKAVINQRELHVDTHTFPNALRAVLREDPDVVLVGEMRDMETVESTLRVAETGHLTFSTLHTNSAAETISRIVDVFPADYQSQVRIMLSMSLQGVITQTLLPRADGLGRVIALEILLLNPAVRNLIRENKIHQIYSTMQMGQSKFGMRTLNQSLADLYFRKLITLETAMDASSKCEELTDIIQRRGGGGYQQSPDSATKINNAQRRQ